MKGAVFDVDGTILDSDYIWDEAATRYLKTKGLEPEQDLGSILVPMTIEEGCAYVKEKYHLEESVEEISQGVLKAVQGFYENEVQVKDGVRELLEELYQQGIPMVIATTGDRRLVEPAFERLGLTHYFRRIFTSGEVGAGKTQPLIFEKCAEYLGLPKEEVCVYEDADYAIETAKKAGFPVVKMGSAAVGK